MNRHDIIKRLTLCCVLNAFYTFVILFIWSGNTGTNSFYGLAILSVNPVTAVILTWVLGKIGILKNLIYTTIIVVGNFLTEVTINFTNPFGRHITGQDYQDGLTRDIGNYLFFIWPLTLLTAFISYRRKFKTTTKDNIDQNENHTNYNNGKL